MGKPRRISLSTRNREVATKLLKEIQTELQSPSSHNQKMRFSECLSQFNDSETIRIKNRELKKETHDENMRYLERCKSFICNKLHSDDCYLSQVSPTLAKLFIQSFKGRTDNETGSRARKYARTICIRFFDLAWKELLIGENPFMRTEKIIVQKKEPDPYDLNELIDLLARMPENTYELRTQKNAIRFAYNTGIRRSNIRKVRIKDINSTEYDFSYIYMEKTKKGKEHSVAIAGEAWSAYSDQIINLQNHLGDNLSPDTPLFANWYGNMLHKDTISKWINKAIARYAPHLHGKTFHKLRTTSANNVEDIGGKGSATEVLGHSDEATTNLFYLKKKKKSNLKKQHDWLSKTPMLTKNRDYYNRKESGIQSNPCGVDGTENNVNKPKLFI